MNNFTNCVAHFGIAAEQLGMTNFCCIKRDCMRERGRGLLIAQQNCSSCGYSIRNTDEATHGIMPEGLFCVQHVCHGRGNLIVLDTVLLVTVNPVSYYTILPCNCSYVAGKLPETFLGSVRLRTIYVNQPRCSCRGMLRVRTFSFQEQSASCWWE